MGDAASGGVAESGLVGAKKERANMNLSHPKTLRPLLLAPLLVLALSGPSWAQALLTEADIKPCEELLAKALAFRLEDRQADIVDYGPGGRKRRFHAESVSDARLESARKDLEKFRGMSPLEYALQTYPYNPLYDLSTTRMFIKSNKEVLAALRSGSQEEMSRVIGIGYEGRAFESRLAGDLNFQCMLNVRLAQLTNKRLAKLPK